MTKHSMKISPEKLIIERGRRLAIHECYMEKQNILEYGEGSVIVARSHKGGKYTIAVFLLDTYCLGIKDTFYRVLLEEHEYNGLIDQYKTYCTLEKIEYTEAHNWIFGALEFAYDAGIKPHKDFAVTQYLLEDDEDESIPIIEYGFGKNGKFEDVRNNIERHDGFAMTADPELDIYREFDALHDFCRQGQ